MPLVSITDGKHAPDFDAVDPGGDVPPEPGEEIDFDNEPVPPGYYDEGDPGDLKENEDFAHDNDYDYGGSSDFE